MIPIKQFLNKIKFSEKFNAKDITLYYKDRFSEKLIPLKFNSVKIEDEFLITKDKSIPLHRIKEIRNKGILIWKRQ